MFFPKMNLKLQPLQAYFDKGSFFQAFQFSVVYFFVMFTCSVWAAPPEERHPV